MNVQLLKPRRVTCCKSLSMSDNSQSDAPVVEQISPITAALLVAPTLRPYKADSCRCFVGTANVDQQCVASITPFAHPEIQETDVYDLIIEGDDEELKQKKILRERILFQVFSHAWNYGRPPDHVLEVCKNK
jgi:hypothetical protein